MSYATHALPALQPFDLSWVKQSARLIGQGMMWLGGGVAFAMTVYVMVALPGLFE